MMRRPGCCARKMNCAPRKAAAKPTTRRGVAGDLAKAQGDRDRLARNHDALQRLIAKQAATRDELAANDLALSNAQAEVKRLSAAKQEFERGVKLDAGRTALQVQQIQSEIASLRAKVASARITAPTDGTLYSLPVKTGDYVKTGDLLAEMADLHRVRVRAFIDEPELGALAPNEPVKITWDALPNRIWTGKNRGYSQTGRGATAHAVSGNCCAPWITRTWNCCPILMST